MIIKGIVSSIDAESKKISVILPEHGNVATGPVRVYQEESINNLSVNDFVLVVVFNDDFNDLMVIAPTSGASEHDYYNGEYEITPQIESQTLLTAQKYMSDDVTVKEIPYYSVSNTSGGNTVYIGSELEQ